MDRNVAQSGAGIVGVCATENEVAANQFIEHCFVEEIAYETDHFGSGADFSNETRGKRYFRRSGVYRKISMTARVDLRTAHCRWWKKRRASIACAITLNAARLKSLVFRTTGGSLPHSLTRCIGCFG